MAGTDSNTESPYVLIEIYTLPSLQKFYDSSSNNFDIGRKLKIKPLQELEERSPWTIELTALQAINNIPPSAENWGAGLVAVYTGVSQNVHQILGLKPEEAEKWLCKAQSSEFRRTAKNLEDMVKNLPDMQDENPWKDGSGNLSYGMKNRSNSTGSKY